MIFSSLDELFSFVQFRIRALLPYLPLEWQREDKAERVVAILCFSFAPPLHDAVKGEYETIAVAPFLGDILER